MFLFLIPLFNHALIHKIGGLIGPPRYGCLNSFTVLPPATNPLAVVARPTTALLPLRAGPSAFISSTSSKSATTTQVTPSQNAEGPPLSVTGKPRREVPLPSQEKKEGAMQYALYVYLVVVSSYAISIVAKPLVVLERLWIKSPTGLGKDPFGR